MVYAEDTDFPVSRVTGGVRTAKVGDTVEIPAYTCEDNKDGTLIANVQVFIGDKQVETTNGKFFIDQSGEYKIIYTAVDECGNVGIYTVVITVVENSLGGCFASVSLTNVLLVISLLAVCMFVKKKEVGKNE